MPGGCQQMEPGWRVVKCRHADCGLDTRAGKAGKCMGV